MNETDGVNRNGDVSGRPTGRRLGDLPLGRRSSDPPPLLPSKAGETWRDILITDIVVDSRKVTPGALFVCASGYPADRHAFLDAAAQAGAAAAVVEEGHPIDARPDLPLFAVPDTRAALADLSAAFWNDPSRELDLFGVTGTNGKTTSTYLLERVLRESGISTGIIGTLGAFLDRVEIPSDRTTPEANDLQRLLREMVRRGAGAVAMEVSSHALSLGRSRGCRFAGAIFTNLTQDHLDFHAGFDDYFAAKSLLFTEIARASGPGFVGVINIDDTYGQRLRTIARGETVTFGFSPDAEVRAEEMRLSPRGTSFTLVHSRGRWRHPVNLPLMGRFNVMNALGVAALALAKGRTVEVVIRALEWADAVPGRFERVDLGQPFGVVVDYAHTPDGLENVLRTARDAADGRVICVFGCGGDRDPGKRPRMGGIAAELADIVIVTSDNPRTENPDAIVDQILTGIPETAGARIEAIVERRDAIHRAIGIARPGDIVLIAGKGHEDYQIVGARKHPFDDRVVAREALLAVRGNGEGQS